MRILEDITQGSGIYQVLFARWCSPPLAFIAGENVLDVDRFRITMLRLDYQFAFRIEFLVELDRNLIESRGSQYIVHVARTSWVEAHHGENSPSGHRTRIPVTRNAVRCVMIAILQQLTDQLLSTPCLSLK